MALKTGKFNKTAPKITKIFGVRLISSLFFQKNREAPYCFPPPGGRIRPEYLRLLWVLYTIKKGSNDPRLPIFEPICFDFVPIARLPQNRG